MQTAVPKGDAELREINQYTACSSHTKSLTDYWKYVKMLSPDLLFGLSSEQWTGFNIFICQAAKQLNLKVQRSYCLTNVILLFILDSEAQGKIYSISFMTEVFTRFCF